VFSGGAKEVRWFAIHLGVGRPEVSVREGDCFVVWSVVSFIGAKTMITQGDGERTILAMNDSLAKEPTNTTRVGSDSSRVVNTKRLYDGTKSPNLL